LLDEHDIGSIKDETADAAFKLMMIADAACEGVGFVAQSNTRPFADFVLQAHLDYLEKRDGNGEEPLLPWIPTSLCRMVPTSEVCVQPKTMTAQVGCTLRSLSHHLALLPSRSEVETNWCIGVYGREPKVIKPQPLNLLIVPFPYRVNGGCFIPGPPCQPSRSGDSACNWRFFSMNQRWLMQSRNRELSGEDLGRFFEDLIEEAKNEVDRVHGLILPELALDERRAKDVVDYFVRANVDLDLFITGVEATIDSRKMNQVRSFLFTQESGTLQVYAEWYQSKHHRWKLDRQQIVRYHLGDRLNPDQFWWEQIDIANRACTFYVFRRGMSLATLICEDLARIDPVQAAIRAVGPNLVIALLMDGPQLEQRWSGRYATVLADDPGSAVLTLSSLGLIARSSSGDDGRSREIAMWKGAEGVAKELRLPSKAHALLLTLSSTNEINHTLDGRSDEGSTHKLWLSGVRGIRHANAPAWAKTD
jgi:hypothetical protein